MKTPRTTLLTASVSLALAPFVMTHARADSAVGTDTVQCNVMNQGIAAGPPVRALYVYNANPAVVASDQGRQDVMLPVTF